MRNRKLTDENLRILQHRTDTPFWWHPRDTLYRSVLKVLHGNIPRNGRQLHTVIEKVANHYGFETEPREYPDGTGVGADAIYTDAGFAEELNSDVDSMSDKDHHVTAGVLLNRAEAEE